MEPPTRRRVTDIGYPKVAIRTATNAFLKLLGYSLVADMHPRKAAHRHAAPTTGAIIYHGPLQN